jgi:hypothetical protein
LMTVVDSISSTECCDGRSVDWNLDSSGISEVYRWLVGVILKDNWNSIVLWRWGKLNLLNAESKQLRKFTCKSGLELRFAS